MKTLTHFITLIFVFFLLTGSSCKKENQLTRATQEGKNTLSCKINGEIFIPTDGGLLSPVRAIETKLSTVNGGYFQVIASGNKSDKSMSLEIYIDKLTGPGNYLLDSKNYIKYNLAYPALIYSSRMGSVNITKYDAQSRIVSGTFNGTLENSTDVNDKISITDGRFDLKY